MKRICTLLIIVACALQLSAQENKQQRFSPEKFNAELQEFITREAGLSQQEAAKFFPVYKEMQEKQRTLFDQQRELGRVKPADEQSCQKNIKDRDQLDLELKRIQQQYHLRFLELLPASKVYDILQAEERFHRHMMKNWGQKGGGGRQQAPHQK